MEPAATDTKHLISGCSKLIVTADNSRELWLRSKGVDESLIPVIIAEVAKIDMMRRSARKRIAEGAVITVIGVAGISYSYLSKVDGVVWLVWSAAGLGILATGLLKKYKIKQYH